MHEMYVMVPLPPDKFSALTVSAWLHTCCLCLQDNGNMCNGGDGAECLQIYVEIERARLTRKLAQLKEAEGNIAEAADVLQEVAVVCPPHCLAMQHSQAVYSGSGSATEQL